MGIEIKKFIRTKDKDGNSVLLRTDKPLVTFFEGTTAEGAIAVIKQDEMTNHEIDVAFVCDGPSCAGHDGSGPTKIIWHEDKENGAPEEAKQILVLVLTNGQRFMFCGGGCAVDFIKKDRHRLVVSKVINISEKAVRKTDKEGA